MRLSTWILVTVLSISSITRAADELNLFAWSEYVPQSVIDGFTKETGIKVNYETYSSNEEMLSKLLAGAAHYDLIQPSDYTAEALIKAHKLAPLDGTKIPNVSNILPEFRDMPGDPGGKFTIPWMTGTVGIVVNTDKIKEPIKGYADVFQGKYNGRIISVNDNRELVSWALAALNKPINDITPQSLAAAKPLLTKWIQLIKVFDSDSPKTALINGDVDLGVVWSGEAALCYNTDKKFAYVLPAEGAHRFVDTLAIPATARHKDAAMQFMNYILRPEVSKLISDKFPYTNPNGEARKLLSPEQLANPASYPKEDQKLGLFRDIGKRSADIDQLVTDIKSGG
jgi:spermidine/putrescine transport system permease protein